MPKMLMKFSANKELYDLAAMMTNGQFSDVHVCYTLWEIPSSEYFTFVSARRVR